MAEPTGEWNHNPIAVIAHTIPVSAEVLADLGFFRPGSPECPRPMPDPRPQVEVQARVPCDDDDCPCDGAGHWETVVRTRA